MSQLFKANRAEPTKSLSRDGSNFLIAAVALSAVTIRRPQLSHATLAWSVCKLKLNTGLRAPRAKSISRDRSKRWQLASSRRAPRWSSLNRTRSKEIRRRSSSKLSRCNLLPSMTTISLTLNKGRIKSTPLRCLWKPTYPRHRLQASRLSLPKVKVS